MQRPDTEDGFFHAGDPLTGTKGTGIPVGWLNALLAIGALFHGNANPPGPEIGDDGDHYINAAAKLLWGPKAGGVWPAGVSLKADGLYQTYPSLELANADLANIPSTNGLVWINADPIAANNGYWAKTGGVLVQGSDGRLALVERKKRSVAWTNTLYASDYASGFFTGAAPTPAQCTVALVTKSSWLGAGVKKALQMLIPADWSGAVIKYLYDANKLADAMASIAFDAETPADFHQGDTGYFRLSYRSTAAITLGLVIYKASGALDSVAGSITLPDTLGEIVEIGGSILLNSAAVDQAYVVPRFYGSSAQNFVAGDHIEIVDLTLQNTPIPAGSLCLHVSRDNAMTIVSGSGITVTEDLVARTVTVSVAPSTVRRLTSHTNKMPGMQYLEGIVPGVPQNTAYVAHSIEQVAEWLKLGMRNILRMLIPQDWVGAIEKKIWYSNLAATGIISFSTDLGIAADFHLGDTLYWRLRYRSNKVCTMQVQTRTAGNALIATGSTTLLPSTAGEIVEISGSWLLINATATQAFVDLAIYGTTAQSFVAGDYIEIGDVVFSDMALDADRVYVHPDDPAVIATNFVPNPNTVGRNFMIFGDSITATATINELTGEYTEGSATANWPSYAKTQMSMASMVNYATSSAKFKDFVDANPWRKLSFQITKAIEFDVAADVVVVKMGTNDGITDLGDFATAMGKATLGDLDRTLLYEAIRWAYWSIAQQWPEAHYFAVLPIQRASVDTVTLAPLYAAIRAMANVYNFKIIDATFESGIIRQFETVGAAGRDLVDGLHPGTTGKIKLANLICSKINGALNY